MNPSKWRTLVDQYVDAIQAGRLGPGDRLPTDAALANLAGVSRVTANKALSELQRLGLVERKGRGGTVVRTRVGTESGRIALVLDHLALHLDFPRADLIAGIHQILGSSHDLVWCDSQLDAEREKAFLLRMEQEAEGTLCWPSGSAKSNAIINTLSERRAPLVLLDRIPDGVYAQAVVSDVSSASDQAMLHLTGNGHRNIALFVFDKPNLSSIRDRVEAFSKFLHGQGIDPAPFIRKFPSTLEFDRPEYFEQAVYDALFVLAKGDAGVTAVVCSQDMFGRSVLRAAKRLGLEPSVNFEVVTYTDWPLRLLDQPWGTHRILTQASEIGKTASEILLRLIAGEPMVPQVHKVPALFVTVDVGLNQMSLV